MIARILAVLMVMAAIGAMVWMSLNSTCLMPKEMCSLFPGCELKSPCDCVRPDPIDCPICVVPGYCAPE